MLTCTARPRGAEGNRRIRAERPFTVAVNLGVSQFSMTPTVICCCVRRCRLSSGVADKMFLGE